MPGIDDRNVPVSVHAVAEVPRFGQSAGGGEAAARALSLPVTVREADFARTYARLSARRQELVIAYPWQHDEELSYRIPDGWHLEGGPIKREIDGLRVRHDALMKHRIFHGDVLARIVFVTLAPVALRSGSLPGAGTWPTTDSNHTTIPHD